MFLRRARGESRRIASRRRVELYELHYVDAPHKAARDSLREKGRRIAREYEGSADGKCIPDAYRDRCKTIASGILVAVECACRQRAVGSDLVDGLCYRGGLRARAKKARVKISIFLTQQRRFAPCITDTSP